MEARALEKLAVMEFPGGQDEWRAEFFDALAQLDRQTQQQRLDELMARKSDATLSEEEKQGIALAVDDQQVGARTVISVSP